MTSTVQSFPLDALVLQNVVMQKTSVLLSILQNQVDQWSLVQGKFKKEPNISTNIASLEESIKKHNRQLRTSHQY